MTLSCNSRSSLTKSSLLLLELVTTNNGCVLARAANRNENVDEGPTTLCELIGCPESIGMIPRIHCLQCLKAPTFNYPGLGVKRGLTKAHSICFEP